MLGPSAAAAAAVGAPTAAGGISVPATAGYTRCESSSRCLDDTQVKRLFPQKSDQRGIQGGSAAAAAGKGAGIRGLPLRANRAMQLQLILELLLLIRPADDAGGQPSASSSSRAPTVCPALTFSGSAAAASRCLVERG